MWNMNIWTDKQMGRNRPDITLTEKSSHEWILVDIVVPSVKNIVRVK